MKDFVENEWNAPDPQSLTLTKRTNSRVASAVASVVKGLTVSTLETTRELGDSR